MPRRDGDRVGPVVGRLPPAQQLPLLLPHLPDKLAQGVHRLLALVGLHLLAGGLEPRPLPQGDRAGQLVQLGPDELAQPRHVGLLLVTVRGQPGYGFDLRVDRGNGGVVGLEVSGFPRNEEPTLARLGVLDRGEEVVQGVQHFVRMHHSGGAVIQVPGVAVSEPGVHHQQAGEQAKADDKPLVRGAVHRGS